MRTCTGQRGGGLQPQRRHLHPSGWPCASTKPRRWSARDERAAATHKNTSTMVQNTNITGTLRDYDGQRTAKDRPYRLAIRRSDIRTTACPPPLLCAPRGRTQGRRCSRFSDRPNMWVEPFTYQGGRARQMRSMHNQTSRCHPRLKGLAMRACANVVFPRLAQVCTHRKPALALHLTMMAAGLERRREAHCLSTTPQRLEQTQGQHTTSDAPNAPREPNTYWP